MKRANTDFLDLRRNNKAASSDASPTGPPTPCTAAVCWRALQKISFLMSHRIHILVSKPSVDDSISDCNRSKTNKTRGIILIIYL